MSKTTVVSKGLAVAAVAALALAGCSSGASDSTGQSMTPSAAASSQAAAAVTVAKPYILPNGEVAGMFAGVTNNGAEAVTLVGGSAPGVGMVQIHEYVKEGTKEVMREIPGGLEIPAGQTVELAPGSYHVMMMKVTADWQPGDEVPVTLEFSDGQQVEVQAMVEQREGMQ